MNVYVLQHSYEIDGVDETKLLGVFETHEKAKQAVERYIKLPGFSDCPSDSFYIDEYELNREYWQEGFFGG